MDARAVVLAELRNGKTSKKLEEFLGTLTSLE
jgi:hypothetical protein